MVKQQVVSGQRERNKGRFKDETNCSRKLGKITFQNHCDSKILKSLWYVSGFNENLSAKFGPNYTGKAGCDRSCTPLTLIYLVAATTLGFGFCLDLFCPRTV